MSRNLFRRTVADANRMVKQTHKPAKQPKQTVQAANRMTGDRARITESDTVLDRGYKKSLEDGPFSKLRPPLKEKAEPKRLTDEQRLDRIMATHSTSPWETLKLKSELRTERRKAELRKEMEAEGADDGEK